MADSDISVMRSSLVLLILKALCCGPRHGSPLAEWVERATEATILIEEGSLYPALHRLERRGFVETEWGVSANNRRAKFYRLAPAGRAELRKESTAWLRYADALARALRMTAPLPA